MIQTRRQDTKSKHPKQNTLNGHHLLSDQQYQSNPNLQHHQYQQQPAQANAYAQAHAGAGHARGPLINDHQSSPNADYIVGSNQDLSSDQYENQSSDQYQKQRIQNANAPNSNSQRWSQNQPHSAGHLSSPGQIQGPIGPTFSATGPIGPTAGSSTQYGPIHHGVSGGQPSYQHHPGGRHDQDDHSGEYIHDDSGDYPTGDDGSSDSNGGITSYGGVDGVPGVDFPNYSKIPSTSFSCAGAPYEPGMYADEEAQCQVYHVCFQGRMESFLCGLGTVFNQAILSCDYWHAVECSRSREFYSANEELGKTTSLESLQF